MSRIRLALTALAARLAGRTIFEAPHYRESETARLLNLFAHIDLDRYRGMKMLEVGAGLGELGDVFRDLGFDVTSSDGRPENVEAMKARGRKSELLDLEVVEMADVEGYELVLSFGVLYHLRDPGRHIRACAGARALFIETVVSDAAEPMCPTVSEASGWRGRDQAVSGTGCRPSPVWVEAQLREAGFAQITDISSRLANWGTGIYDWEPVSDGSWRRNGANLRKMWVCERD